MLSIRTIRTICAVLDTVALTAIAAAISKSVSRQRRDLAAIPEYPSCANPPELPFVSKRSDLAAIPDYPSPQTPSSASSEPALVKLKKERDPERLFELFRANAANRVVVENRFAFEDTVVRLAGAGRMDLVEELLEHQKALPQGRREGFVVRIIMLYGKAGMPGHACRTFDEMPMFGCPRTVKSFNATLRVLAMARQYDDFKVLFSKSREEYGICLDGISYNLIVKLLCDMGSLEGAYLAMVEMEKAGVQPDVVTYTTLMAASYKNNRREIGDGLWNLMLLKGCSPNLAAYNARVQFLIHKWRVWQANHLVGKMSFKGIVPDEVTYNLLIKGFFMAENVEMAKRVFYAMPGRGCKPNSKIYQTMVHYLCKLGDFDLALKLCKDSMERNWFPSVDSIGRLLEGLAMVSNGRGAKEIMGMVLKRVPPYSSEEIMNLQAKFCHQC